MGGAESAINALVPSTQCCTARRAPEYCKNLMLKSRLAQLAVVDQCRFHEVWMFPDDDTFGCSSGRPQQSAQGATQADHKYVIVYLYAPNEQAGLEPLRLSWRPDGLGFVFGQQDLQQEGKPRAGARLKVFKQQLRPAKLLDDLQKFENKFYDPFVFNARHFCEMLFSLEEGTEY
mmetsp:Transcript_25890/g.41565  ORF Transcript_25890/g.41565 Transcript_25890/m.41565 type:complete len:175 (-) Transcript_25890:66-590(-)